MLETPTEATADLPAQWANELLIAHKEREIVEWPGR